METHALDLNVVPCKFFIANKWNGMAVTVFKYRFEDRVYVSAKPRGFAFLKDFNGDNAQTLFLKALGGLFFFLMI